jgi:integrase
MSELKFINIEDVIEGEVIIDDNFPMSKKSKFKEDIWDFNDKKNPRLNSVNNSKLRIEWNKWRGEIPDKLIDDVKVLAFFYFKCPSVVAKRSNTMSKGYKPNTISVEISYFLEFLEEVFSNRVINLPNSEKVSLVQTFSDITLSDIEEVLMKGDINEHRAKSIKKSLQALGNPIIHKYLYGDINWTSSDIKNFRFNNRVSKKAGEVSYQALPLADDFIQFITKKATIDIISFLKQKEISINSPIPDSYKNDIEQYTKVPSLRSMFNAYVAIRESEKMFSEKNQKRTSHTTNLKKKFKHKYSISIQEFNQYLNRVHRAALFLLFLFTGVRYSESASFKVGGVKRIISDVYVIRGTVIKHRDSSLKEEIDEWVACPIVRDAVNVLEEISLFTFNKYLVSNTYSVYLNKPEIPFSNGGVNQAISNYAANLDVDGKYTELKKDKNGNMKRNLKDKYSISVHRLRHTLALNLVRAKLGIPYISYHFKHAHTAIISREKVSNVTLGYGGISNELFNVPTAVQQAQDELVYDLYHPNSPVEGGNNKEEFKKRRKEYFQGMMVNDDWELEEIMEMLKDGGAPFADVGLGYCGGRKDLVMKDGTTQPPPCLGQLKCNPLQCGNAIIPKSKLPIWVKSYKNNKDKLNDPYFSYAKKDLEASMKEAKGVLEYFNVKVDELQ